MVDEKQVQRKYSQLQMLKQRLELMQREKAQIDQKLEEIKQTISTVSELPKIGKKKRIWSNIGSACFALSNVKETDKVVIGVGANVLVKKKTDEALELLKERQERIGQISEQFQGEMQKLMKRAVESEQELEQMVGDHETTEITGG